MPVWPKRRWGQTSQKRTKYIANGPELLYYLQDQCIGVKGYCSNGQKHGDVSGRRVAEAAIYLPKLCEAMAKGIARQHERDDVESEESDGRHDETISPKIRLVVRKWNRKVQNINVSKAGTFEDIDVMTENQSNAVKTDWIVNGSRMAASTKIGRVGEALRPQLLQDRVCKDMPTGREKWSRRTVIAKKPIKKNRGKIAG